MQARDNHRSPARIKSGGSPLLPPLSPSPRVRAMEWDASCLHGSVEGLPDCSWELFCAIVDIDQPEWGMTLLEILAESYGMALARENGKDPYIVLLLNLTDQTNPDDYYVLNVLQKQCTTSRKNWTALANEIRNHKECGKREMPEDEREALETVPKKKCRR